MSNKLRNLCKYWWAWCFSVPFVLTFAFCSYLGWADQSDGAQQSVDLGYTRNVTAAEQTKFLKQALPTAFELGIVIKPRLYEFSKRAAG